VSGDGTREGGILLPGALTGAATAIAAMVLLVVAVEGEGQEEKIEKLVVRCRAQPL